jgi:hypothetical protein
MWYYNYYIACLLLTIVFYLISTKNVNVLISIIIIFIIGYFYFNKINEYNDINKSNKSNIIKNLNSDINDRKFISDDIYYLKKISNKILYLDKDETLLNIILNIRFVKQYDYEKYTNLINYFEKFYKIYIFILADRYDIKQFFTIFISLRNAIIKEMYSMYIILPQKMKYNFGFDSFEELNKSIKNFIIYSRKLITILERFGYYEKKVYYLEDTKIKPYDYNNSEIY